MLQRKRCDPFRRAAYVGGGIKLARGKPVALWHKKVSRLACNRLRQLYSPDNSAQNE
jgi:hypothetical protein